MKSIDIINDINSNGGFDNFRNWNKKEIAQWVKYSYKCSNYIANKVAESII